MNLYELYIRIKVTNGSVLMKFETVILLLMSAILQVNVGVAS